MGSGNEYGQETLSMGTMDDRHALTEDGCEAPEAMGSINGQIAMSNCRSCADLEKLQHGLAHFVIHVLISKQLCFQSNGLPQMCVRLAQNVVQVHSCLHRWLLPLHPQCNPSDPNAVMLKSHQLFFNTPMAKVQDTLHGTSITFCPCEGLTRPKQHQRGPDPTIRRPPLTSQRNPSRGWCGYMQLACALTISC